MLIRQAAVIFSLCSVNALLFAQVPANQPVPPVAPDGPKPVFEIASVKLAPKAHNQFGRFSGVRGGRFEVHTATMLDLIRTAYGYQNDKIIGGPSWLESTRYDIAAKVSAEDSPDGLPNAPTTPDSIKLMLQSLLESRFALKVHKDVQPQPTYALVPGKKNLMKEGDSSGSSGCKPQDPPANPAPGSGGNFGTIMFSTAMNGEPTTLRLGPGGQVTYACRNLTMAAFVTTMRTLFGTNTGVNPILEQTGIKGTWSFDITYSVNLNIGAGESSDRIAFATALEKQLGLKLEKRDVPTNVLVVDGANETPAPDPSGVAESLPLIPYPTEFEVASVTLSGPPQAGRGGMIRFGIQPGGRFQSNGLPLRFLIDRAFNSNNREALQNVPDFAQSLRVDVTAKANIPRGLDPNDPELLAKLMLGLLTDRFKMTYHTEERPVNSYQLGGSASKLKKADPAGRSHCGQVSPPPGSPPGTRFLKCVNATMAMFADALEGFSPDLPWPIADATGISGNYDFTFSFTQSPMMARPIGAAPAGAGRGDLDSADAADPGGGYTIFQAIEKQLGLKLEKVKRNEKVIVIDHLEQKPTEN